MVPTRSFDGVVHRHRLLEPRPESARLARRTVTQALAAALRTDLSECAELLVSELVTNAIVHARTAIEIDVVASPEGLRVTVRDGSAQLPSPRHYGADATTGRGLELVELMADRHGSDVDQLNGKRVWFELGSAPPDAPPPVADVPGRATDTSSVVTLVGVPLLLAAAWRQQADALLREYVLTQWDGAQARPGELLDDDNDGAQDAFGLLADALGALSRDALGALSRDALGALSRDALGALSRDALGALSRDALGALSRDAQRDDDATRADFTLHVPAAGAQGFVALSALLDLMRVRAKSGLLLAPVTLPEVVALRRWMCDQVARQLVGEPPTPWPGLPGQLEAPELPGPVWAVEQVRLATGAVVAADDSNRILAASPDAFELLGWDEALVGQRIAAIIPERLREAHVAGFTLHLLTGAYVMLDREVSVPALRRDGSEVPVLLLVRREHAADGRAVFVAMMRRA